MFTALDRPTTINPTAEEAYWRSIFKDQPYYVRGLEYQDYSPAYRVGYTGPLRRGGNYPSVEAALREDWNRVKDRSRLTWEQARPALRAAWERVSERSGVSA